MKEECKREGGGWVADGSSHGSKLLFGRDYCLKKVRGESL